MRPPPRPAAPTPSVCAAWGVSDPVVLTGGQGAVFAAGQLVLKAVADPDQHSWLAEVLEGVKPGPDLRIIRPLRTRDGRWAVEGWTAWERLEGEPDPTRWREALVVSEKLHQAFAPVPWSSRLHSTHPWATADAYAWAERDLRFSAALEPIISSLRGACEPVELPSQLIHGDLGGGNILYQTGLAPAVIDISPYWRPKPYADAILVIDSIAWAGVEVAALEEVRGLLGVQLILRALLFRLAAASLIFASHEERLEAEAAAHSPIIEALGLRRH